ncbi:eight-cysteine-cluster domain-containing protein [Candidatus Woesearchaeota archaeon]|nr:eight-cysteine-cluster domain-containing protein [Candidatus Woesearchaeota archaeon]
MKRVIMFILILSLILFVGCNGDSVVNGSDNVPGQYEEECKADEDCIVGGCSGTICSSKQAGPIFSTCEWKPEYECYKEANCGCVQGRCAWKDGNLESCIQEKKDSDAPVIV